VVLGQVMAPCRVGGYRTQLLIHFRGPSGVGDVLAVVNDDRGDRSRRLQRGVVPRHTEQVISGDRIAYRGVVDRAVGQPDVEHAHAREGRKRIREAAVAVNSQPIGCDQQSLIHRRSIGGIGVMYVTSLLFGSATCGRMASPYLM
jgi:hypothetical protein